MTHPLTDPLTELGRARTPKTNPETRKPGKTASDLHVQPPGLVTGLATTNPETRRITGFPGLTPDPRSTNPAAKPQVRGTLPGFRVWFRPPRSRAHARPTALPEWSSPIRHHNQPSRSPQPMSAALNIEPA